MEVQGWRSKVRYKVGGPSARCNVGGSTRLDVQGWKSKVGDPRLEVHRGARLEVQV